MEKFIKDIIETSLVLYAPLKALMIYKLHRKPMDIGDVDISVKTQRRYSDVDINRIRSEKVKEVIREFTLTLINHFPAESLTNYYNNINSVIFKKDFLSKILGIGGSYSDLLNRIRYNDIDSLYHELFHLASTVYREATKTYHVGFTQSDNSHLNVFVNGRIGDSLNEGYTVLLTQRYFGDKGKPKSKQRQFEFDMASKVEMIVGKEKMESLYLEADLMGLINELKKYATEDEVVRFINALDRISEQYGDIHFIKSRTLQNHIFFVNSFLMNAYRRKLDQELYDSRIGIAEYNYRLSSFTNSLKPIIKVPYISYLSFPTRVDDNRPKEYRKAV